MAVESLDVKKLLESGAHFGHKTSRWHPKMAPYIFGKKNGAHIIDLTITVQKLDDALGFITQTVAQGKQILLVGTKRQAKDIIKSVAESTNMPYVNERWLGGMLTNWTTIGGQVKHLKDLESKMQTGELNAKYSKLEVQRYQEEIDQKNHMYGGIKEMSNRPGALFIVDIIHEINALKEARKLGIPVVAIIDTNADPSLVTYPIPANDDAIKAIQLIADHVKLAIERGKSESKKTADTKDKQE